jgi:hypothetical protein
MGEAPGDLSEGAPADAARAEEPPERAADRLEQKADRLEQKAEAIRDELGDLVGELGHRRRELAPRLRLVKPLAIAAGVAIAGTAAARAWRRVRRRRLAPARRIARRFAGRR